MRLIHYLRTNGIRRVFEVLYQYKLPIMLNKIFLVFLKRIPLQNIIMIESHNDFDCNGGAFYDYLIQNRYNQNYKIVWLLKTKAPNHLPENVVCVRLYGPDLRKAYYNCIAKFLLADNVCTAKLRTDQVSIYLTHGAVGLKDTRGISKLPDNIDYILSPSVHFEKELTHLLSLDPHSNKFIHVGYPCNDVFYQDIESELKKVTTRTYRKVILWMPTFRKGGGYQRNDSEAVHPLGVPLLESCDDYQKLNELLISLDVLLLIKIHPKQDLDSIKITNSSHIKVLLGVTMKELQIDNYRLYKSVDAMVSDYSSAAYDFLFLNKPLAYDFSDLKDYKLGLVVENPKDFIAGDIIYKLEDFVQFLEDIVNGIDNYKEKRIRLFDYLYQYHDGDSCKRLVEFMGL